MTTPMMQQYWDAKKRHPGMLLLFRMGDFYELFDTDAEIAGRVLGLTVTSRDKSMPMAGFPHHQLENYLKKLLASGARAAVCDQVEDPAQAKGIVKREVTRVVTPGTITEDDLLDPRRSNHLVSLAAPTSATVGLAWLDLSTGAFQATDVPRERLADELARLAPAECICAERDGNDVPGLFQHLPKAPPLTARPDWTYDGRSSAECLHKHFRVRTMSGFGFEDKSMCLVAAGALLAYAQEMLKTHLGHIRSLRPYCRDKILQLDEVTRRSLELTRTLRDGGREGSLLAAIDRTVTTMGARLLQEWLLAPLADRPAIEARLDAVAEFGASQSRLEPRPPRADGRSPARLTSRVSTGRATPRDLGGVARTLTHLPALKAKLAGRKSPLLKSLDKDLELCPDLRVLLDAAIVDEPPHSAKDGGVIRPGHDAELDEIRDLARSGKEWIARFQATEIERTGIPSLKVGFNSVFGYYIEITHTHAAKIPDGYQRKQTLKNAERYITPELKEYEEKVLTAEERLQKREYELFCGLRDKVAAESDRLLQTAEVLAQLDVLAGLAELAVSRQYVRPTMADEPVLSLLDGRHPVLDQTLPPGSFVPNDAVLDREDGMLWLITGPNMSGKSTFIRQVACLIAAGSIWGASSPPGRRRSGSRTGSSPASAPATS